MSDEILKKAAQHPLFQPTFAAAMSSITHGSQLLLTLGINVTDETEQLLKRVEEILREATSASLNLDELLEEARAIGDEFGKKAEKEKNSPSQRTDESLDSSEGNLGESN